MSSLPEDLQDLLVCLHDAGAEFLVVGGVAVAFHGHPRATKDLDVLVRATPDNSKRVFAALGAFGAPIDAFDVGADDFAEYEGFLQVGVAPIRADILTRVSGISFDEARAESATMIVGGRAIPLIGLRALVRNKRAAGRPQDIADVAALRHLLE